MTQEIGMAVIVAGAAIYLARMVWLQTRGKSNCGCGKSGGCASKAAPSSTRSKVKLPEHFVQIQTRDKTHLN
jgi:hypothetical protein